MKWYIFRNGCIYQTQIWVHRSQKRFLRRMNIQNGISVHSVNGRELYSTPNMLKSWRMEAQTHFQYTSLKYYNSFTVVCYLLSRPDSNHYMGHQSVVHTTVLLRAVLELNMWDAIGPGIRVTAICPLFEIHYGCHVVLPKIGLKLLHIIPYMLHIVILPSILHLL